MEFRDLARCGCIMLCVWIFGGMAIGLIAELCLAPVIGVVGAWLGADYDRMAWAYQWVLGLLIFGVLAITFLVLAGLEVRKTHRRLNE